MRKLCLYFVFILGVSACAVGPDYQRPTVNAPAQFKEADNWKLAQPQAEITRGEWWSLYNDAKLDELMQQLNTANQNIRAAEARYRQSRALVQSARANFLPTLGANASVTRGSSNSSSSNSNAAVNSAGTISKQRDASLDASWELDVWGRVRRSVESSEAGATASAADLASALLSAQAELAIDYFQLRILDARQELFDRTSTRTSDH